MNISRFKIAKPDIIKLFDDFPMKILRPFDIERILFEKKEFWRLADSTSVNSFIEFMLAETRLQKVKFDFPYRAETRYTWGEVSDYEIIMSLKPNSYFTHYTALYLHELTEQIPKTIYLNYEQSAKHYREKNLEQNRIDAAFRRPVRLSNNVALYRDLRVCLLNGMYTDKLGVIEFIGPQGEKIHVTDIERTLIDITVRPEYAGGIFEVLKAYGLAHGKVSINKLSANLKKLNYIYPYHQAIGFYLEKSDVYKESHIELLRKFDIRYDFYLAHQIKDMEYSKNWRLYFPKGL
jgi:predicted transcriptional regulator of viral defense system